MPPDCCAERISDAMQRMGLQPTQIGRARPF